MEQPETYICYIYTNGLGYSSLFGGMVRPERIPANKFIQDTVNYVELSHGKYIKYHHAM